MIRQSRGDVSVLLAGNFLVACFLLGSCAESDKQSEPLHFTEDEKGLEESVDKQEFPQEIGVKEEEGTAVSSDEFRKQLIVRLHEEQWRAVFLELKDPAEIDVPSDDFNEPQVAHAVLSKDDLSMNYAWLEINEVNSKLNEVWQKHWESSVAGQEILDEESMSAHLASIQRKYGSLMDHIRFMEFKSATEHAQHLHDYKLYLEGVVLYRIEAAALFLEALETGKPELVEEAAAAAIESEAYARMSDSELTSYQQSFRKDPKWNPE